MGIRNCTKHHQVSGWFLRTISVVLRKTDTRFSNFEKLIQNHPENIGS
jgi:hypothetical protein